MNKEDLKAIQELLREELKPIKSQLKENTDILKALGHKVEVNKAEIDKISNDTAHISGHLKSIGENIDAVKEVLGRHEVDITVLKRRPV
ncbi:hypothetical protein ACJDT4_01690 [Clostridium neuense]|uniref:Uncharacterized protein n=1 Tax=Clostridium neuense TaxID=1728934 RepID=A0ABW8TB08_9CLOT